MNNKLLNYKNYIKNKKTAVIGIGVSNTPLVKYLCELGVEVSVFDSAKEDDVKDKIDMFSEYNVKFYLGDDYLKSLKGFDVIFKTPIVRPDIPELLAEKENGAVITSEMEVFVDLCPAEIFAVTGSDGKTTTTTLIYEILKESGYKCWLGGNIGTPLLNKIDEIKEDDKVVLELSSFQLHTFKSSPDVAIITNLSPNHLDIHKSMDEYIEAKKNIFKFQKNSDTVILNFDNEVTNNFIEEANSNVIYFSRVDEKSVSMGAIVKDGFIKYKNDTEYIDIVDIEEIMIPGVHNIENYLAAVSAVIKYTTPETIKKIAKTFGGVEHRCEFIRELNGVKYYNDSIGSSPTRTIASIKSFKEKVILITGGYDKKIPYECLGPVILKNVKTLILVGQTGGKIEEVVKDELRKNNEISLPIIKCEKFEDTIKNAYEIAKNGDIVILSPASASFDMFKNFAVRGNYFKELVNKLK